MNDDILKMYVRDNIDYFVSLIKSNQNLNDNFLKHVKDKEIKSLDERIALMQARSQKLKAEK